MSHISFFTHSSKIVPDIFGVFVNLVPCYNIKFCGFEQCLATLHKFVKMNHCWVYVTHLIPGYSVSFDCCHMLGHLCYLCRGYLGVAVKWIAVLKKALQMTIN